MSKLPNKRRRSVIWKIESDVLQNIINDSTSIKDVLNALGLQGVNGENRNTLEKRIKEDNLDLSLLRMKRDLKESERRKIYQWNRELSNDDLFCENSNSSRSTVRNRLLKDDILSYKCSICLNEGMHNNEPLSLHLDHINGINNDNRLDNLRFLCPNCHSQTMTYAGKKRHKIKSGTPDLNRD